jgi:hypothetical protein
MFGHRFGGGVVRGRTARCRRVQPGVQRLEDRDMKSTGLIVPDLTAPVAEVAAYPPGPSAFPPGPTAQAAEQRAGFNPQPDPPGVAAYPPGPSAFPPGPTAVSPEI